MKKNVFQWFPVILGMIIFLAGCPEAAVDDGAGDDNGTSGESISLLLAGRGQDSEYNRYPFYATIQIDGGVSASAVVGTPEIVILDDIDRAYATGIARNDASVIVSGYWMNDSYLPTPCLWTNGTRTDLPLPAGDTWFGAAQSVDETGDHIGGLVWDTATEEYWPCYWSGGVLHLLEEVPIDTSYTEVSAVTFIDAQGIYLAGIFVSLEYAETPCYWHIAPDGTETRTDLPLPDDVYYAGVGGIAVDGGSVHVSGIHGSAYDGGETVCCWSNGVRTDLAPAGAARGSDIVCHDGNAVVAGMTADWGDGWPENFTGHLWYDGIRFDLSTDESWPFSVNVLGSQIVVTGWSGDYETETKATVWLFSGFPEPAATSQGIRAQSMVTIDTTVVSDPSFHLCEFVAVAGIEG